MQVSHRKKRNTMKRDDHNNRFYGLTSKIGTRSRNTVSKKQSKKNTRRKMASESNRLNRSKQ